MEREFRILSGGEECTLIGGVACVSTGSNTERESRDEDEEDELNTGGVSLFLCLTGWLLPEVLLLLLDGGKLTSYSSNMLSNILLNKDFCLSGCSGSCSASLLGLLDILLSSSFNCSICSISDLSELLLDEEDEPVEELKNISVCVPFCGFSFIIIIFLS